MAGRKGGVKEAVAELLRPGGMFSQTLQEETGVRIHEVHEALVKVLSSVKKDTVRRHIGEFVQSNFLRRGDNHVFFAGENWRSWGGALPSSPNPPSQTQPCAAPQGPCAAGSRAIQAPAGAPRCFACSGGPAPHLPPLFPPP